MLKSGGGLKRETDNGWMFRIVRVSVDCVLTRITAYGNVNRDGNPQIVVIDSGLSEEMLNTYYGRS